MTYSRNNRKWKLCAIVCQVVRIEACHISGSPATTNHYHHIKGLHVFENFIQCLNDGRSSLISLHNCRKKFGIKDKLFRIVTELVAKIIITSSSSRGDNRDSLRKDRNFKGFVHFSYPIGFQLTDDFLPARCLSAKGKLWVNVPDVQT
ncbi:hypothetical protein SDC9_171949 [bioreactor metagenome]|uniref:Uncharacterized protein n=1 Tax=bioreactor metagenome TaxID=1076179 RepID=A0A645GEN4_9ZZZZ